MRTAGELVMAEHMGSQVSRLLKNSEVGSRPLQALLRAKTTARKRKIEEDRAAETERRERLGRFDKRIKLAGEKRLAASHKAKSDQAAAKIKELDAKEARAKEKASQTDARKNLERLRRTFACDLARRMVAFTQHKSKGAARTEALLKFAKKLKDTAPWKNVARLPGFWDATDRAGLQCVSVKDMFGVWDRGKQPVFATEGFSSEMFGHTERRVPPQTQLRNFVEDVMPGYKWIVGPRFQVSDLLKQSRENADVAFMSAAWYYSSIVPSDLFRSGFRAWPPAGLQPAAAPAAAPSASSGDPHGSSHSMPK